MAAVKVGDHAPDFNLRSTDGEMVSLSDQSGSNVVLAFFPAAFTGVCQTEMCTFRDSLAEFNGINAKVFGISVDPPFSQAEFHSQNDLTFPLLSDLGGATVDAYGVSLPNLAGIEGYNVAQRSVFVIDGDGHVRWAWVSDSPLNEPSYDDVKAALAAI
ncbi:MAG: peroxiredoxin [Chloroflexi bacterium]|nr:peroxiredoxin [Chloroflexota bacterium]